MDNNKYTESYIQFRTSPAVYSRGMALHKNNKVLFKGYSDRTDAWDFHVQGSQMYHVKISGINSRDIKTSCTCPFDWGSLCKHCVAALLFTLDNNPHALSANSDATAKTTSYRSSSDAEYEIDDYSRVSEKWVYQNTEFHIFNTLKNRLHNTDIIKFDAFEESLVFHISMQYENYSVVFQKQGNRVFVSSSERAHTAKLKISEAFCLLVIANSNNSNLLDMLLMEDNTVVQKRTMESFGLPSDADFNNYFKYDFNVENGFSVIPLDLAKGLLPVNDDIASPLLKLVATDSPDLPYLPELSPDKGKRALGFVMRFSNRYYDDYLDKYQIEENVQSEIIPIIGKPNKTESTITSLIEEYIPGSKSFYSISISDKQKEIIELIELSEDEDNESLLFQYKKRLFQLLLGEKYVYTLKDGMYEIRKSYLEPIGMSATELDITYQVSKKNEFIQTELKLNLNEKIFDVSKINRPRSDRHYFTIDNVCYCAKNLSVSQGVKNNPGLLRMVYAHKDTFYDKVVLPLSKDHDVDFKKGTYQLDSIELDFHKKQVYLSEHEGYLIITLKVLYDNDTAIPLHRTGNLLSKTDERILKYVRNHELEYDFVEQIAELHPNFDVQKSKRMFYLHMNEFMENMWFYKFFDQLTAYNIEVFGLNELKNFKYSPYKGNISTSISSGVDWFEVNVNISFGNNIVSLKDIRKAVLNKEQYIRLKDGSVGIMPTEWFHKLEKYFRNGEIEDDRIQVSKLKFSIIDELFEDIDDAEILFELAEKKKKLEEFTEISETVVPEEIKADLRHYQKEGLNWLNFLDTMQWGGILADDMGLGKTLQVLTFLQHILKRGHSTNLIVVPTTLLFNWQNEIGKFAPNLKAWYHYGSDRVKDCKNFDDYHIVFTTYGILLRDIEMLREFKFNYVFLDESQAIKNPASRRYKAANLLQSYNRVALSGTPIENSTFDLFAQMNFVNRGFLGNVSSFKENYSNPIDKEGNELIANELQKVISPFILRRTKEKVASELPPKTEDIIYCEMESEQRKVYDAFRNNYKDQLLKQIEEDGIGKSKMMVLEALTRLRQICDSPELIKDKDIDCTQSIKIKQILRHITNKTANHKILVFSQFVKMLGLVKAELDKLNIKYEYLDGQCNTSKREKSVKNFQESDDLRVFLISLKAGGTGLNLTAADYVYILDPWWNPAVENQAIDRCYRIGQDKNVFAYRMICKNTIEEKIATLQQKKRKIAGDIIQTDENIMKTISSDDIKELFS